MPKRKPQTLGEAMAEEMKHSNVTHLFPTELRGADIEAWERAKKEHAPGVAVRIRNFRVEYYNTETGEIVSSHY